MKDDWRFIRTLVVMLLLWVAAVCLTVAVVRADWPALPSESKGWPDLPGAGQTVEVRREPVKKIVKRVWGLIPCPTCPSGYRYGWMDEEVEEPTIDQAAAELAKGGVEPEREKVLRDVIDEPERKKARAGHWDPGSCAMLCTIPSHGTHWTWDDPVDDGTPEPAWGSWQQGDSSGECRRFHLFRRR